jgi:hypothetical protein
MCPAEELAGRSGTESATVDVGLRSVTDDENRREHNVVESGEIDGYRVELVSSVQSA